MEEAVQLAHQMHKRKHLMAYVLKVGHLAVWDRCGTIQRLCQKYNGSLRNEYCDGWVSLNHPFFADLGVIDENEWDSFIDLVATVVLHGQVVIMVGEPDPDQFDGVDFNICSYRISY